MTIRRAPRPRSHYTVVSNAVLEDGRLSFKAAGVLVYLLSKPDHWEVSREHLAGTHTDGVDAIRTALRELRAAGYITDDVTRDDQGRIADKCLVVHDSPQVPAPTGGKPPSRTRPQVGDPALVIPDLEQQRTEVRTEPSPSAQLALVPQPAPQPRGHDLSFEAFWSAYPRKVGKIDARKAWQGALRHASDAVIVAGAERYRDDPNREDQFTAHPATWLRRGSWADEPMPSKAPRVMDKGDAAIAGYLERRNGGAPIPTGSVLHHGQSPTPKGLHP